MIAAVKRILKKVPFLLSTKRKMQSMLAHAKMRHLGNQRTLRTNAEYASYHAYCKMRYLAKERSFPPKNRYAKEWAHKGFATLPRTTERQELAQHTDEKLEKLYHEGKIDKKLAAKDPSFIQIADCVENLPEIFRFVDKDVEAAVTSFYGSYFKFYRVRAYRTLPKKVSYEELKNAWRWHTDDYPNPIMKIMVYLTNADSHSGAFRTHPYESTKRLYSEGFFDRYHSEQFMEKLEDPKRYVWLSGKAGDVVFFDNNLAHRATPPQEPHHRDVIVFEMIPSPIHWKEAFKKDKHKLEKEEDHYKYPEHPFSL